MATIRSVTASWRKGLVQATLPKALAKVVGVLADRVRSNAPRDSGDLAASVHPTPVVASKATLSASVVVDSDHALPVEYGTIDMEAQPYFRPAVRSELPGMIRIVRDETR